MTTPAIQFGRVPYQIVAAGAIAHVKPAAAKVYLVLLAHADVRWTARVGMRRIAALGGVLPSSVCRSIKQLCEAGLIATDTPGNGQPFTYRITTLSPVNRSPASERFTAPTVRSTANALTANRSPAGAPTVRPLAQKRSPTGEQNRKNRPQTDNAAGAARKPDPIWDAVVLAFGLQPVTKAERSRVGRIVRDLKAKGASPDDITQRLDRYRAAWPKAADTPEAVLKHWDRFGADRPPGNDKVPADVLDRICPPTEPSDEDLRAAYGDSL